MDKPLISFILCFGLTAVSASGQTFNHLYPDGNGWAGVEAIQTVDGFRLLAKYPYFNPNLEYLDILTDGSGYQLSAIPNSFSPFVGSLRLHDDNYAHISTTFDQKIQLQKLTSDGTLLWSKEYSTESGQVEHLSLRENENGEFFISGIEPDLSVPSWQYVRGFVIKTSSIGDSLWTAEYPFHIQNSPYYFYCGGTSDDGGAIILHYTENNQFLMKYDANGILKFNKHLFGCCSTVLTGVGDGGNGKTFYSISFSNFSGAPGPTNTWSSLTVLDENGNGIWGEAPPYPVNLGWWSHDAWIDAAAKTNEDGMVMAGTGGSYNGDPYTFYLAKYSPTGQLLWSKHDYGIADAHFVKVLPDDRILVSGKKDSHTWLMLTDAEGNTCSPILTELFTMQCDSQTYQFENELITGQGTSTHVYQNQNGCDSLIRLTISAPPADTNYVSLELCQDDFSPLTNFYYPYAGVYEYGSLFHTNMGCDSLIIYTITVHPKEEVIINTLLEIGATYHGVVITQDTQFIQQGTTAHGCLLTITENVTVLPSATNDLGQTLGLLVFPNPTIGDFTIEMDLEEAMELRIEALDRLGRRVALIAENVLFANGKTSLNVDARHWPSGVYLLDFQAGNAMFVKRIIKI